MQCILLALFPLLAAEMLDHDMASHEAKKTGVHKLTAKEKASLQEWIDTHYQKRAEPLSQESAAGQRARLEENLQNGQYIRLANGTIWNIDPENTNIVQGWITPVDILVSQKDHSAYPYKLTNSLTGSSVQAKRVDRLPASQ